MEGVKQGLWTPRCWPMWACVAVLWGLVRLPLRLQFFIGSLLGRAIRRILTRRSRIARKNVELCFPRLEPDKRESLLRDIFDSLGIAIMEMGVTCFGSIDRLRDRCEIDNLDVLLEAQAEGQGVILAGTHFMALELCSAFLAKKIQFDCVFRPSRNRVLDFLIWKARTERFGHVMEVRSLGRSVRRLREGKIVWFAVDQDMGHAASIFVPFMGIEAATLTFVPKLASRTGAPVVFMSHHRDRSAMKWAVGFERLHEFPSEDLRADAIRINQHVEKEVWKHPEQYYWVHRRFKSLPDGSRREY